MAGPASLKSLAVRPSTPHDVDGLRSLIRTLVSYSDSEVKLNIGAYTFDGARGDDGTGISFSSSVAILAKKEFKQLALSESVWLPSVSLVDCFLFRKGQNFLMTLHFFFASPTQLFSES